MPPKQWFAAVTTLPSFSSKGSQRPDADAFRAAARRDQPRRLSAFRWLSSPVPAGRTCGPMRSGLSCEAVSPRTRNTVDLLSCASNVCSGVPVRVGCVRCTYFVNEPLNNYQHHRAHNSHSTHAQGKKMMERRADATPKATSDLQAPSGRTDGRRLLSGPCWQLGDRRLCRWRHRPRRGSDLRGGCSALEPRGGRGARPPARPPHRIRRSSPPPCAASSSFRPRRHRRGTPRACIFHGGSGCDSDCGSGGGLVMATAATNLRDGKIQPCCAEVLRTIPQARIWRVDVEVGV